MLRTSCFGFGAVVKFIDKFFQFIWMVIRKLSLQPLLTVGAVWLILAACLPKEKITPALITVLFVLIGLCAAYALAATVYNLSVYLKETPRKKKKKEKTVVSIDEITAELPTASKPVYYRVKQNPKYVMAEYPDRYELFYENDGELQFVKMNMKKTEDN